MNKEIKGIFHCSAGEAYTKYEMSRVLATVLGLSKEHIKSDKSALDDHNNSVSKETLLKPMDSKLCTKYSYELIQFEPIFKFENSILECIEKFV